MRLPDPMPGIQILCFTKPLVRGFRTSATVSFHERCRHMYDEEDKAPPPPTPEGLKAAGTRFWDEIFATYSFPGSPEMVMLAEEAARTADVVARLQAIVDNADTLRTRGSRGQDVAIPELDALRQYRAQFAALVKQLDLPAPIDDDEDDTGNVVPLTRSQVGLLGAQARWGHRRG